MEDVQCTSFHQMGLDDRILKAIAKLGWKDPTLIQQRAIPLALEGKDVLARARTGSGKSAAFIIPVLQKILNQKQFAEEQVVQALVLAPSKELCSQICSHIMQLTTSCSREVRCIDISSQSNVSTQKPLLVSRPDIIVSTPSRILAHIKSATVDLNSLEVLVIDEADLLFSFGFETDMSELMRHLPKIYQGILTSATLSDEVLQMKKLILHNPVTLQLKESILPGPQQLTQFVVRAEEDDKFVLLFTLLKLKLIKGKTIIFVRNVDRSFLLKLFLEQFGISSCVLNSELPIASRCHVVEQFNNGLYETIIASDEKNFDVHTEVKPSGNSASKSKRKRDRESGVSRGIDFQFVSNVLNFDFPPDLDSYIHRVGRTARGDNMGTALSFVSVKEEVVCREIEQELKIVCGLYTDQCPLKPYKFKMDEVEGFRYRSKDARRAVTKLAIRNARRSEIRREILNCQKLKTYFKSNPQDLRVIRHDKHSRTVRIQPHLKDVPDYIVPPLLKKLTGIGKKKEPKEDSEAKKEEEEWNFNEMDIEETTTDKQGEKKENGKRKREHHGRVTKQQKKYQKRKSDPLQSLEFKGFGKKKK